MIKNYLLIAVRHLLREKGYSFISIAGLAVGMACGLLICLYMLDEYSYDRFHANAGRIYRITLDARVKDKDFLTARSSGPLAKTLMSDIPGVEAAGRIREIGDHTLRLGERAFTEYQIYVADSTLFDIFSFSVVEGNQRSFLTQPYTVVLSDETARRYFGDTPALGRTIMMDGKTPFMVCGVVKAFPARSHWHFSFLISSGSRSFDDEDYWIGNSWYTYVLLKEGVSAADVEAAFAGPVSEHVRPLLKKIFAAEWSDMEAQGMYYRYRFQPLTDIHLYSRLDEELEPAGTIDTVSMFGMIGVFILVLACINFMNLSTARSARRAKEVGVRKVLGSRRAQLVQQFLSEAILLAFIGMLISIGVVELALPSFNSFVGKNLSLADPGFPLLLAGSVLMVLFVGLFAGSYPAFVLSSLRPAKVLKGDIRTGMRSGWLRTILVIAQFTISIGLIVGTLVVSRQLKFVQSWNLGFDKEHLLVVDNTWLFGNKSEAFRDRMLNTRGVTGGAFTQNLPGNDINSAVYRPEGGDRSNLMMFRQLWADADFLSFLGVKLKDGRHLSRDFMTDSVDAVVINESAARALGYEHPVGRRVIGFFGVEERALRIVGVTEDFHYEPLHTQILPMVVLVSRGHPTRIVLRVQGDIPAIIEDIRKQWVDISGGQPFTSFFLDSRLERYYRRDEAVGTLFGILATLGVFISSLGLLGLAMYATEQRTKEMGIRKVFGAGMFNLAGLLTKEFAKLIVIANLVAWPLAYYAMRRWLDGYAYRIDIGVEVFLIAGAVALCIALLTVGYHTIRAAIRNPIESLRYE
jgi:putative ABC transport system permease protein